jgi:hypothetical protein
MKTTISLIILTSILCGCSSTSTINSSSDAKNLLEKKEGSVELISNEKFDASDFHVSGDSLTFTTKPANELKTIALQDITRINRLNRSRGVGRGIAVGAGAVFALWIASAISNPDQYDSKNGGNLAEGAFAVGTVLGGAIGAGVGGLIGISETYMFLKETNK